MKCWKVIFGSAAMVLSVTIGCQDVGNEPPIVEIVSYDAIPQPFTDLDFWRIGFASPDESGSIRDALLKIGVPVQEAWESHDSKCAIAGAPMALQIIVRLRSSDSRVLQFGFVPAGDANVDKCWTSWKHYRY